MSPISTSSSIGGYYPDCGSVSTPQNLSPTSPPPNNSQFFIALTSQGPSTRAFNPSIRSRSFPTIHQAHLRQLMTPRQETVVRSRAASLPFFTCTPHLAHPAGHNVPSQATFYRPAQVSPYAQRNLVTCGNMAIQSDSDRRAFREGQPSVSDTFTMHDDGWPRLDNDFAGYSPTDTSCNINVTENPRYGSLDALTKTQHSQPIQSVQNALLAAPPEFRSPQWTSPHQVGEAGPRTGLAYGEQFLANQLWLSAQAAIAYQMQHAEAPPYPTNPEIPSCTGSNQKEITPKPKWNSGWPG
ncbi:MAG: hypothetical protein Q9181_001690 [Wetmoreana brouardii]